MAFVVEYHEELEIDLHRQAVDLLDLWRGTLSFRRLELLVRHLDAAASLTVRAINPDAATLAAWDANNYQLADIYDVLARANFKDPKPYPRPGPVIEKRNRDDARRAALVARFQAKHGRGASNG